MVFEEISKDEQDDSMPKPSETLPCPAEVPAPGVVKMGFRALGFMWRLVRLTDYKGRLFMPQVNHPCGLTPHIILYQVSKPLEPHSGLQPHKVRCLSYTVI